MFLDGGLGEPLLEAVTKQLSRLLAEGGEARQRRVLLHQLDQSWESSTSARATQDPVNPKVLTDDPVAMLPRRLEPLLKQPPELPIRIRLHPAEHLDVLERELERCSLEPDVARRVREHEPEVDVDEVPVAIEENVAVVSVLDLEEVGDDRVAWCLGLSSCCGGSSQ